MRPCIRAVLLAGVAACAQQASAAGYGGQIVSGCVTNSQMQLLFQTTSGCAYQVQSNPTVGSRFWSDTLPPLSATGSLASVLAPAEPITGFFRVLEFTNRTFWYDWGYYYEDPNLTAWGLGSTQSAYMHIDRPYDWYIDQAGTGPDADANCGPASVTMAIKWYNQSFGKTVADARNKYPEGGGWWYTYDVINYLNLYSVPNTTSWFTGTNQLMGILNQGNLVILCLSTADLGLDDASEHRVGRFYSYVGGHFLVVKGWRIVGDALFFEVYDPYNWQATYADTTPKGRNRHLPAGDLSNAIARWWNYLIVIPPPGGGAGNAKQNSFILPVDPTQIAHKWGM